MQMSEFLLSLLKLITQMVTGFDGTRWTHSRNELAVSLNKKFNAFEWRFIYYLIVWSTISVYTAFSVFTFD